MDYIGLFLGFVSGCIASAIVSLVWYKIFVPKIKFADTICKYDSMHEDEVYTYKVKFRNTGKRDIFEMYLYCTLFMPDLLMKDSVQIAELNVSYDFRPLFKKRKEKNNMNPDGLIRICFNDSDMMSEFARPIYPKKIRDKAEKKQLTLEDLLTITSTSYLKFYIIAHDRFTGSKKIFESPSYTSGNVKKGLYKSGELYVVS
ncbi:MAG: hypothetical protein IJE49_06600 [Agathobacter sp.]|nr:hypothetical protein [Agathobacter sp.]